jgi:ribonucleoside-diphosphate reductase alpha chain
MQMPNYNINIDPERDSLFDQLGIARLKESYMMDHELSPQERFAYVSKCFSSNQEHAQRLYDYSSKHWLSYSTPILSYGKSSRGLPISCYLNYIHDSAEGLVNNLTETNWLSMLGGGVGIGFGIRSSDDKSTGVMPHLKMYDASSLAYRQGKTRRGSYAAYLDIDHPDIVLFLEMRKPTGDQNFRCLNMHHGINVSDKFMKVLEACMLDPNVDDTWELRDPHSKKVCDVVSAKEMWQRILEMRMQTGEPYLHFIDRSNEQLPAWLKQQGLKVHQSNLCSEIILPTSAERTAVCCLSSVNLEHFDDWSKDKQFLPDVLEMLDNVLQLFINNAPDTVSRAKFSAERERSVGVGALGFHAMLQKRLDKLIKEKCSNDDKLSYDKIWSSIIANDGSVQHLRCLDDYEKELYKTSMEIDQRWVIEHAADRQQYIDQAQSLNVFFRPDVDISYLHAIHFMAWKKGLKTMYYCRSEKIGKADKVSRKIERQIIQEIDMEALASGEECLACEG